VQTPEVAKQDKSHSGRIITNYWNATEELLGRVPGKKGPERGTDGRETRREWRLTGIQTVADSVLPGAKKSATTGKTPCGCRQKVCD